MSPEEKRRRADLILAIMETVANLHWAERFSISFSLWRDTQTLMIYAVSHCGDDPDALDTWLRRGADGFRLLEIELAKQGFAGVEVKRAGSAYGIYSIDL